MKEVFILKKVGDIEYLVINKKDVEMFCNIQRGVYETKYFRENCLTDWQIINIREMVFKTVSL